MGSWGCAEQVDGIANVPHLELGHSRRLANRPLLS